MFETMQAKLICCRNINERKIHYRYIGINCFKCFSDFYQLMYRNVFEVLLWMSEILHFKGQ